MSSSSRRESQRLSDASTFNARLAAPNAHTNHHTPPPTTNGASQLHDAALVTADYLAIADESTLRRDGMLVVDAASPKIHLKVHSLLELEPQRLYLTPRGSTLLRTSRTEALLAGKVHLSVDLVDSPSTSVCSEAVAPPGTSRQHSRASRGDCPSPPLTPSSLADVGRQRSSDGDGCRRAETTPGASLSPRRTGSPSSSSVAGALRCVRMLRAAPTPETLRQLERTFTRPPAGGWLQSFLDLDGVQALLDVLSHALAARATHDDEEGELELVQARCVSCLSLLTSRHSALGAVLQQPQAITCLVGALGVRSARAQRGLLSLLLRIALQPPGTAMLLAGWWALRQQSGDDEPRLAPLVRHFAAASSAGEHDTAVGVLKLAYVMASGPAELRIRAQVRQELAQLKLVDVAERSELSSEERFERALSRLRAVIGDPQRNFSAYSSAPLASPALHAHQLSAPLVIGNLSVASHAARDGVLRASIDSGFGSVGGASEMSDVDGCEPVWESAEDARAEATEAKVDDDDAAQDSEEELLKLLDASRPGNAEDPSLWESVHDASLTIPIDRASLIDLFAERVPRVVQRAKMPERHPATIESLGQGASVPTLAESPEAPPTPHSAREHAATSFLSIKRAQHVQITLSRFRVAGEGQPHLHVWQAMAALDPSVLSAEDIAGLITCLPTEEEADALKQWKGDVGELSPADAFQWRSLSLPRARERLLAFQTAQQFEITARALERDLDHICSGCAQLVGSQALRTALVLVLATGNAMNEWNARLCNAAGFGLEALANLMSVKTTNDDRAGVTLLHFVARQLAAAGVTAATLRAELRRVPDATRVDMSVLAAEVERLRVDVAGLRDEVTRAAQELIGDDDGEGSDAFEIESTVQYDAAQAKNGDPPVLPLDGARAADEAPALDEADLDALCTALEPQLEESPPEPEIRPARDGEATDEGKFWSASSSAVSEFATSRVVARLGGAFGVCNARVQALDEGLARAHQALRELVEVVGPAAEADSRRGDAERSAQCHLNEVSNFLAAIEKAERDNAREEREAAVLARLQDGAPKWRRAAANFDETNVDPTPPQGTSPVAGHFIDAAATNSKSADNTKPIALERPKPPRRRRERSTDRKNPLLPSRDRLSSHDSASEARIAEDDDTRESTPLDGVYETVDYF